MDSRIPVHRHHHVPRSAPRELYDLVVDFPAYPRLFPELKEVRVLSKTATPTGVVARVEFRAHLVLPIRYVLDLACVAEAPDGAAPRVDWKYVEGEIVTANQGSWRFQPEGDGTGIDYEVSLDVKAPVPSFLLRKIIDGLVTASLPNMFVSLERELRKRQAGRPPATAPSSNA
jgi:ribosome-associated toxin RatA of RatAB toxin-antitoxin module